MTTCTLLLSGAASPNLLLASQDWNCLTCQVRDAGWWGDGWGEVETGCAALAACLSRFVPYSGRSETNALP